VGAAAGGGEAPTQIFPGGAQSAPAAPAATAGTSPLGGNGAHTDYGAVQRPTEYHSAGGQQTTALVGQPFGSQPLSVGGPPAPPKRRRGLWLFALLAVFVLGAGLAAGSAYVWGRATRQGTVIKVARTVPPAAPAAPAAPEVPGMPALPADLGERIKEALKGHGVPLPLDESDAVVAGDATTITRTYGLGSDATFKAHIVSGNVTVVGADDADEAIVKIIKRGGSAQERAATQVLAGESDEGVMLVSTAAPGGRVSVSYEITVPRQGLHKLELSAQKGDIKVSEFDGELDLNVTTGNVSVASNGAVRSRVVNGRTSVTYAGRHDEAQEFTVVNGDVEVSLTGEPEVELKAASTNGRVEVDGALPLKAEKGGRRVEAELGGGGAALNVKVVNGNIKLKT
jgi:hypothetical protein